MKMSRWGVTDFFGGLLFVGFGVVLAGCPKEPEAGETKPPAPAVATTPLPSSPTPRGSETRVAPAPSARETTLPPGRVSTTPATTARTESSPKDVFFDYDKAALTDETKRALTENAAWLRGNPQARITVEGHCDERGTSEYNLGLGDRRAKAVRDYLVAAGIEGSRIRTLSYGKERPFVQGHDESAWRWNRRAHFALLR